MDADLTALARLLVALPGWEWRPGVYPRDFAGVLWSDGDLPDLLDAGNGGILLDRLGPGWTARHAANGWAVYQPGLSALGEPGGVGPSLASAVARAMVARARA